RLTLGEEAWRATQSSLVEGWLRTPSTEFAGWAPVEVIHAERTAEWADAGTTARARILRAVLPRINTVTDPPDDPVTPLRFLLGAIGDGIALTTKDRLPVELVRDIADRFGWGMRAFIIRNESDVVEISELRDLATRTRLIELRLRHHTLSLTSAGRA